VSIAERVAFVTAPGPEAAASLHVLAAPTHHPRQAHWVRRCRTLPDELKRAIRAAAPVLRRGAPEAIVRAPSGLEPGADPLLADYWRTVFSAEWDRIFPALEAEAARRASDLERGELPPLLRRLGQRGGPVVAVPSVFAHPHTWIHEHPDGGATVVYPIEPVPLGPAADDRLPDLLRAIASEVRLTLLRLIAVRPRSTKELAGLAYLSEPSVSRHLNQMAGVGLLRTRREGYYVVYEVDRNKMADISRSLHHLFPR
jgi:DNA-binding transcriptional ArsR family regulator